MKEYKAKYISVVFLVIIVAGMYFYFDIQNKRFVKQGDCAEIGMKLGKENRDYLNSNGFGKVYSYEDAYSYSEKLGKCLYYKSQIPLSYETLSGDNVKVAISSKEIIDAYTNKKIITLSEILNSEGLFEDLKGVKCFSYDKNIECGSESDFMQIKSELFK